MLNRLLTAVVLWDRGTGTVLSSATKSLMVGAKEAVAVATGPIAGEPARYDVTFDAAAQLTVQRGWTQSAPETLAVAPAQPAVFTVNEQGSGQAVATVGNTANLADTTHPVKAGDALVIYCAGLGAVSPPVANGAAAPAAPPSRDKPARW